MKLIKTEDAVGHVLCHDITQIIKVAMKQPPSDKGKRLKLYYITQVSVKPPTFVVFINDRQLMHFSYTRYLENQIRNTFGFRGTPIHIIARERKER